MWNDSFHGLEFFEINLDEDMKQDDECWACHEVAIVYWEPRYHGWRGKCMSCDTNWALS